MVFSNSLPSITELGLVDTPRHEDFDRLTRLAAMLFGSKIAIISIVEPEKDRQYFTSAHGLPEPWATTRETRLSHSFSQYVISENAPLVVEDARTHPLVQANGAVSDLGVVAYLGAPIYGPDDAPIGALCVIEQEPRAWSETDIAALKDLSDAVTSKIRLRASVWDKEQLLRKASLFGRIVERAAHEVFIFDAESLRFIEVNTGARENLGFTMQELNELTPVDLKPDCDRAEYEALILPLRDGRVPFLEFESSHRRKDGSDYLASVRLELHHGIDDLKFVAFCRDITEQRQLERVFEEAIRAMPGRFMMFDAADKLIFANKNESAPIAEMNQGLAPGMALEDFVQGLAKTHLVEDASQNPTVWADKQLERLRGGQGIAFKDVNGRFIEVRQSATQEGGRILLSLDVTKREEALVSAEHAQSEADTANQAKSEFLAAMSHELRTPLNAVIGFGQLLEADRPRTMTPDQQEYAQYVVKSGQHLLSLVSEVLDLAGIEAGHLKLSIEPVDAQPLISSVLSTMAPVALKSGIRLALEETNWRPKVQADVQRLRQVLLNLVSNAIKYNSAGGSVSARLVEYDNRVRIEIADTGLGIEESLWSRVFTPFDRLGHDSSAIEGAGIGLALCKQLAEAMNGTIGFKSSAGVGSTFWIDLALADMASTAPFAEAADALPTSSSEYSLLYVEDNPSNLRLMEHLIATQPNVQMFSAPSGGLGLELAKARKPDVIVLDINLPGMSGFDILRYLKSRPETWNTPVIALTASAMPNDVKRGLAAGFFRYITKPLDVNEFLAAIELALNEKPMDKDAVVDSDMSNQRALNN